jgi:hypothetical protein
MRSNKPVTYRLGLYNGHGIDARWMLAETRADGI